MNDERDELLTRLGVVLEQVAHQRRRHVALTPNFQQIATFGLRYYQKSALEALLRMQTNESPCLMQVEMTGGRRTFLDEGWERTTTGHPTFTIHSYSSALPSWDTFSYKPQPTSPFGKRVRNKFVGIERPTQVVNGNKTTKRKVKRKSK